MITYNETNLGEANFYCDHHLCQLLASNSGAISPDHLIRHLNFGISHFSHATVQVILLCKALGFYPFSVANISFQVTRPQIC